MAVDVDARSNAPRVARSGAERHLEVLAAAQVGAGHGVSVILLARGLARMTDSPDLWPELVAAGVAVRVVPQGPVGSSVWRRLSRFRTIPDLVHEVRRSNADVVHTHLLYASQVGKVAARLARSGAVVDSFHNDEPFLANRSWRLRLRSLDRITAQYIAISSAVRARLVDDVGLPSEKVHVVRYGVPLAAPVASRSEARARLSLPEAGAIVGYVGRLVPQKRLEVLVEAMASLPDVTLALIGEGELRADLEELCAALGSRARFLGLRPDAASLMSAFDVFCLPSRWEGLGVVLLEAMAAGIPIVGSRHGAIPEVLDGGRAGLVFDPDDALGLASAVQSLLDDPRLASTLVASARERLSTAFSVEEMMRKTDEVYDRALRGEARRRRS